MMCFTLVDPCGKRVAGSRHWLTSIPNHHRIPASPPFPYLPYLLFSELCFGRPSMSLPTFVNVRLLAFDFVWSLHLLLLLHFSE